jgi:hypothetical protein
MVRSQPESVLVFHPTPPLPPSMPPPDYLASFASNVPALIELEEPLCVLFQRLNAGDAASEPAVKSPPAPAGKAGVAPPPLPRSSGVVH